MSKQNGLLKKLSEHFGAALVAFGAVALVHIDTIGACSENGYLSSFPDKKEKEPPLSVKSISPQLSASQPSVGGYR